RSPLLFAIMSIGIFSLMGLPLTAGFMAKLFIFTSAVDNGLLWLMIIAVLNTVISAYYYLRIIRVMWLGKPSDGSALSLPKAPGLISIFSALGILLLGIAPYLLLKLAENIIFIP
ncbi:MAG: proton-conducting transporter membrane subunit, partial [Dehalococcoidales bacterium]|nr:proton-conducting transporter membrane subunit [Dehalococcoidales bacterium]